MKPYLSNTLISRPFQKTLSLSLSQLPFSSPERHLHRAALVIELAIHITDLVVQVTEVTISLVSRSLRSPKVSPWDSTATEEAYGLEEKMDTQKISVSDHINGFHYTADKSDSFVIDMENFSHGTDKDITPNSRASMQRNLSRKWSQRDVEKKINYNAISTDRDVLAGGASSPLAAPVGSSTPKSPLAMGTIDHSSNPQVHHQITVTAANIGTTTDGRCVVRRNSFRRSSSWAIDPKRVLFFFATMSSIGTILLIYFTLSIAKYNADESLDWQQ